METSLLDLAGHQFGPGHLNNRVDTHKNITLRFFGQFNFFFFFLSNWGVKYACGYRAGLHTCDLKVLQYAMFRIICRRSVCVCVKMIFNASGELNI